MPEDSSQHDTSQAKQPVDHHTTQNARGFGQQPLSPGNDPLYPTSLLNDPRLSRRGNEPVLIALMRQAQQTYGNRALQRQPADSDQGTTGNHIERAVQRWEASRQERTHLQRSTLIPVQRDDLGLGFTDLVNQNFGSRDFLDQLPGVVDNMSEFRRASQSMGVGGFDTTGQISNQRVGGAVQSGFADTFRLAVVSAKKIKSNLAGFTPGQLQWAYNHRPELTGPELALLTQFPPADLQTQTMVNGRVQAVNPANDAKNAEYWSMMGRLPTVAGGDPSVVGRHAQAWSPANAAVSVWELSNLLHNKMLFDKTDFYYYNRTVDRLQSMEKKALDALGIKLNQADLMTTQELGLSTSADCFITTACVTAKGLPDDCEELTILRAFRDGYMRHQATGPAMIAEYYDIAPRIVSRIRALPNGKALFTGLYGEIAEAGRFVKAGRNEDAMYAYVAMVQNLKHRYL